MVSHKFASWVFYFNKFAVKQECIGKTPSTSRSEEHTSELQSH